VVAHIRSNTALVANSSQGLAVDSMSGIQDSSRR
jgi:hypothetical protein